MDVLADPQTRLILYYAGGAVLVVLLLMTGYFFWLRMHKIHNLAQEQPDDVPHYNGFLLFLSYFLYALLVFLFSALLSSVPLVVAVYLGIFLSQNAIPLLPLLIGGVCIGLFFGYYVTFKFLRSKVNFEESKMVPMVSELP